MRGSFLFFNILAFTIILSSFASAESIWTTRDDCGALTQNVNHYALGEAVYINGEGFSGGTYSWEIKGQPGGASCDPGVVVASGTKEASGSFCLNAYTILSDDCGEYQVKFGNKGDNYRVDVDVECSQNSDCGQNGFVNSPYCTSGNVFQTYRTYTCNNPGVATAYCSHQDTNILKQDCGEDYCGQFGENYCKDGDVYHSRTCYDVGCNAGSCFSNSSIDEQKVTDCEFGCTNGTCNEPHDHNITLSSYKSGYFDIKHAKGKRSYNNYKQSKKYDFRRLAFIQGHMEEFDLSSIPTGATIDSAKLAIYCTKKGNNLVYAFQALRDWNGDFSFALNGGGDKEELNGLYDKDNNLFAGILPLKISKKLFKIEGDVTSAVQNWVDNPVSNFGFVIREKIIKNVPSDCYQKNAPNELKPKLEINYTD